MKNDGKDPDDTFSDLLKVIALAVIAIFIIIAAWHFG